MNMYKVIMRMPGHTKQNYMMVKAKSKDAAKKEALHWLDLIFPDVKDEIEILNVELEKNRS